MSASPSPSYQLRPTPTPTPLDNALNPGAARMGDIVGYLEYLRISLNLPGETDTCQTGKLGSSMLLEVVNRSVGRLKARIAKGGVTGTEAANRGWDAPAPQQGEPWTADLGNAMHQWLQQQLANREPGYQSPANLEDALITIGALGEATLKRVSQRLANAT